MDKEQYQDHVMAEIAQQLDVLFMSYDTKLLASVMFVRSCTALRALHSAGVWKVEDVQAVVQLGMQDIYSKSDKVPPVSYLNKPGALN